MQGRFLWWSKERGHYHIRTPLPNLEIRERFAAGKRWLLVIRHDKGDPVSAGLPGHRGWRVLECSGDRPRRLVRDPDHLTFGDYAVRVFELVPKTTAPPKP